MIIIPGAVSILEHEAYADNPAGGDNLWQKLDQNICVEEEIPWHHAGSGAAGRVEDEEEKFQSSKPGNYFLLDCVIMTLYCSSCARYDTVTQHSRITYVQLVQIQNIIAENCT